jgi:hypothetical protein
MASSTGEPSFLEILRNILITYKGTVGNPNTLADVAKIARIEPITLISSNLSGTKELYEILHGILNIYAAYYLQAINVLSAQLADVRILKILDKTNPDRDLKTLLASGYTAYESYGEASRNVKTLSLENCKFKLPMLKSDKQNQFAIEAAFDDNANDSLTTGIGRLDTFDKLGSAVGKVIELRFNTRKDSAKEVDTVTIPVVVKLDNMIIPSEVIDSIITSNSDEITLGSRFKDAISGRISFIKDFLLCSDLIKSQKKSMIKDPTGYYAQMLKRVNNSRLYSALSGNISLAGISSIVVLSEEDEQEVQKAIGGKLTNEKTREMVFNNTSAMMIVVVDRSWQRVSIYVRDIDGFSQNSFDSFKGMSSKSNDNLGDLLKAFNMNSSPSF